MDENVQYDTRRKRQSCAVCMCLCIRCADHRTSSFFISLFISHQFSPFPFHRNHSFARLISMVLHTENFQQQPQPQQRSPDEKINKTAFFFLLVRLTFRNCLVRLHLCAVWTFRVFYHLVWVMLIPRLVTKDFVSYVLFAVGFVSSRNYSIPGTVREPGTVRIQPRRPPSQREIIRGHCQAEKNEEKPTTCQDKRRNRPKGTRWTQQNTQNLIHNFNFSAHWIALPPFSPCRFSNDKTQ